LNEVEVCQRCWTKSNNAEVLDNIRKIKVLDEVKSDG
jgi:hypothetical protein